MSVLLESFLILEEEEKHEFILTLVKRLDNSISFLKSNLNNSSLKMNSFVEDTERLLREAKDLNNRVLSSDLEQQNIYRILKHGIEPRTKVLSALVNKWREIHKSDKLRNLKEEINYFPY